MRGDTFVIDTDMAYLERRIREESMGDYGVEDIQG